MSVAYFFSDSSELSGPGTSTRVIPDWEEIGGQPWAEVGTWDEPPSFDQGVRLTETGLYLVQAQLTAEVVSLDGTAEFTGRLYIPTTGGDNS